MKACRNGLLLLSLMAASGLALDCQAAEHCTRLVATGAGDAAPYLWRDPQHEAHFRGTNLDALKLVGSELGIKIEIVYTANAAQAFDEVKSGRVDVLLDAAQEVIEANSLDALQAFESAPTNADLPAARYLALAQNSACNDDWLKTHLVPKLAELRSNGWLDNSLRHHSNNPVDPTDDSKAESAR